MPYQFYHRLTVTNCVIIYHRSSPHFAFRLGRKTQKFSGTNQKPERRRPFGTGLVRHCPQGLFSPFFTFLCAIFFRPLRLSLAPTICHWVSKDDHRLTCLLSWFSILCLQWVKIPTNETDIVMLAVSISPVLPLDELWKSYGSSKQLCNLPAQAIATSLGWEKVSLLLMFHTPTRCDTVSFF